MTKDTTKHEAMDETTAQPVDLIESYLDGELSEIEARRVERLARTDAAFAAELELAHRIQGGLRAMQLDCPPEVSAHVTAAVEAETASNANVTWRERFARLLPDRLVEIGRSAASLQPALLRPTVWRPAAATLGAAALALVAFIAVDPLSVEPTRIQPTEMAPPALTATGPSATGPSATGPAATAAAEHLSPEEVEAARREVELAFAYLGQLGRTAENSVIRLAKENSHDDAT